MNREIFDKINGQCREMKVKTLELAASTGKKGAHIGGAFSIMEIIATFLNLTGFPAKDDDGDRDRLILSKGHGALALYTGLWQSGVMSEDELEGFDKNGTGLYGHPHFNPDKGLDFSAGSLGLGMSFAVGTALAMKRKSSKKRVYVILGDGECNEGIVWEALMSAAAFKLSNLTVIVDKNKWQLDGATDEILDTCDLARKFDAFGFDTVEIDGHDISEIAVALSKDSESNRPRAIIANTVKANGISFLMNSKESHFCPLTEKKLQIAINEINASYGYGE